MPSIKNVCDAGAWLDQSTSSIATKRLGWLKKRALLSQSTVSGEKAHNGPSSRWFDVQCPTIVGSVHGKIYKVAITITAPIISPYEIVQKTAEIITNALGSAPIELPSEILLWDGDDGNVVVQPVPNSIPTAVMVFLTSNAVRSYVGK